MNTGLAVRNGSHFLSRFRGRWPRPPALVCVIGVLALLYAGGEALAAGVGSVVPRNGAVAGHGYGYWLQRSWQFHFSSSPPVKPCQTLTASGQHVGYLTLATLAPRKHKITCNEPAGRPLYIDELSAECSTLRGDHGNFGTSGPQLERCARTEFNGLKNTTTLDGRRVDMKNLVAATGVYLFRIPKNNSIGAPPGKGRSAAYGYGLLLRGLGGAKYVIHSLAGGGGTSFDVTWTVHVH